MKDECDVRSYGHFINGIAEGESGRMMDRVSSAHGKVVARFSAGDSGDVDRAVHAALACHENGAWRSMPGADKARILNAWADLVERDAGRLAKIEAEEASKVIQLATFEMHLVASMIRFASSLAWKETGEVHTQLGADALAFVAREPVGVVGMITPWNYPLVSLFHKLPYALAAGCTALIKPSAFTAGSTLEVARLAKTAGLPDGAINVVTGSGRSVGEALIAHPSVAMVSFTGSTAVGKTIAERCGATLKKYTLELGGKGANVVFADADIDAALDGVLLGFTLNQGEECMAGSRLIIHRSIAGQFVERLAERAARLKVGLPLDPTADLSALIHAQHLQSVEGYVARAVVAGGTLVLGGERLGGAPYSEGAFMGPTIVTNVTPDMELFQEEVFGPVLAVTAFDEVDEAADLVNGVRYGLANGVWSKDIDLALTTAQRIVSGTVFVNTYMEGAWQLPIGGRKESGVGRENGMRALDTFSEEKQTFVKMGPRTPTLPHTL